MKKLYTLLILPILLLICPHLTFADNHIWNDTNFSFGCINQIKISKFDIKDNPRNDRYRTESSAQRYVEQLLQQNLAKKNIELIAYDNNTPATSSDSNKDVLGHISLLNAEIIVHEYASSQIYVPEETKETTTYEEIVKTDSRGNVTKIKMPVTKINIIPAHWDNIAYVDIEFLLTDPDTNKAVFNYRDSRSRRYETNSYGMASRVIESFANKLSDAKRKSAGH